MANYYPSFNGYGSNPYLQQINQPIVQQPIPQQIPSTIYGKIVDSIETARAQEVPLGSYAVFPKADMSCVYIKTWQPDGTTSVIEYPRAMTTEEPEEPDILQNIYSSIAELNNKIDKLDKPTRRDKREVSQNA